MRLARFAKHRLTTFLLEKKHDLDTEEDWLQVQLTTDFTTL